MKHSSQCLNLLTDELVALADMLATPLTVHQSLRDRVGHLPAPAAAKPGSTTLSAGMNATTDNVVSVANALPAVEPGDSLAVDSEHMLVTQILGPTSYRVIRGTGLSAPALHTSGATVAFAQVAAPDRVRGKLAMLLASRSDYTTTYAWPYSPTPPTWTKGAMQVASQESIDIDSQAPGEVVPPAPWTPPQPQQDVTVVRHTTTTVVTPHPHEPHKHAQG